MKIFKLIVTFLLGTIVGISLMIAVEIYMPESKAKSYACYKNGNMTFKISVDGKMETDDKFYPVAEVSIDSIHWFYHIAILKDTKQVDCE